MRFMLTTGRVQKARCSMTYLGVSLCITLFSGIQFVGPVETYPEDKYYAIMDVCLHATFHASKAALPHMRKAGWGRIINTVRHIQHAHT